MREGGSHYDTCVSLPLRLLLSGAAARCLLSDVDAFLRTEVELSKAKRQYATLEKRLDEERTGFR